MSDFYPYYRFSFFTITIYKTRTTNSNTTSNSIYKHYATNQPIFEVNHCALLYTFTLCVATNWLRFVKLARSSIDCRSTSVMPTLRHDRTLTSYSPCVYDVTHTRLSVAADVGIRSEIINDPFETFVISQGRAIGTLTGVIILLASRSFYLLRGRKV